VKNCAILTMDNLQDFECYDFLLDAPLAQRGWKTHLVSWRDKNVDWDAFEVVIIRSPWDYQRDAKLFIQVLENIEASSARLENPLNLVKWNLNKTYLKELQQKDIPIVPTIWVDSFKPQSLSKFYADLHTEEIVIKPILSANADNTFRLPMIKMTDHIAALSYVFSHRSFMVQPFMQAIVNEGEFSLFYFAGGYSHAILKKPKKNDFRVQEEHGGILTKIVPERALLQHAERVNQLLDPAPLYSRLDFVRYGTGFAVMEIELIEPSLYFNMDKDAAERFAQAFVRWMAEKSGI